MRNTAAGETAANGKITCFAVYRRGLLCPI